MSDLNITALLWISVGLFGAGLIVLTVLRLIKKDNALSTVEKYLKDGLYKKALNLSLKFVTQNPNDFLVKYYIGQSYEGMRDFKQAVQYYEKASIAASLSDQEGIKTQIFLKIADIYRKTKRVNESMGYYVLALEKDPHNIKALMAVSEMMVEEKNYRRAREYLETLVKIKADNIRARFLMAKVYFNLAMMPEAAAQLEFLLTNIKVNDDVLLTNTYILLSDIYIGMKSFPKALELLKKLLENEDQFENALVKMIDIYVKLNRISEAQQLANANIDRISKERQAEIYYMVGNAYFKINEIYKAAKTWEAGFKKYQGYKDLKNLVSRYAYLIQNPNLEPLYSKSDTVFESFALKMLKLPYIKQTIKKDTFWAFESGDKSYVIYRRPFPITTNELTEVEHLINQNFRANSMYKLYSLYGVVNENKTSNMNYNSDKMELISDADLIKLVNDSAKDAE